MLIETATSALMLIDAQARLLPAIHDGTACIERCRLLLEGARRLAVPILAAEQYPQGLGTTVPALAELVPPGQVHPKRHFAAGAEPAIAAALQDLGRPQIVLCGMEAHVCVLQTALDLPRLGLRPIVVADAVASRRPESRTLALARLRARGIEIVSAEMVLFEWLGVAGTPEFKALLPLIR
jgi:nicotinamidase-related amidase